MESLLEIMQGDIERYLNSKEELVDIPVISHSQGNLEACLEELMQTGIGTSVIVMNPIPTCVIPTDAGLSFEGLDVRVRVIECPGSINTEHSALGIAEYVSKNLDHYKPRLTGWEGWLELNPQIPFQEIKDPEKLGRYLLDVNFKALGSIPKEKGARGNKPL